MTNAYCDLDTLKSAGALNISGNAHDRRLLNLLEEASRLIDGYCNRHFYVLETTRQFEANWWSPGLQQLLVPDLISVDSARVAAKFDGGAGQPKWRTASYRLYPMDASPERAWGRPYTRMAIEPVCTPLCRRTDCHALVEIAGRWGYRLDLVETGATTGAALAAGDTTVTLSDADALAPGHTLALDDEQVYVTAVAAPEATLERGVNGTEAAAHTTATPIRLYRYPGPVSEGCLQLAVQLWHTRDRAARGFEDPRRPAGEAVDPGRELKSLVAAYRKLPL
ncbi:MAG: hypothetical protein OXE17_01390 [Chloroflexi bacterium]|nr:hypothetical protein [Chloroflexota bacterium]